MSDKRLSLKEYLEHPAWPADMARAERLALRCYWCFGTQPVTPTPASSCLPGCLAAAALLLGVGLILYVVPNLSNPDTRPLLIIATALLGGSLVYGLLYFVRRVSYRRWARKNLQRVLQLHRQAAKMPWRIQCLIRLNRLPPARRADFELDLIGRWYSSMANEDIVDHFEEFERSMEIPLGAEDSLFSNDKFIEFCQGWSWGRDPHELIRDCLDYPLEELLRAAMGRRDLPSTLDAEAWESLLLERGIK